MVLFPSKIISLSIGPFPNGLPIGPHPSLLGPSVPPTKILLGYLESFRLSLLPCSFKLPLGPRSCWTFRKWTGRLACQNQCNTPRYLCSMSLAPTIAKIRHTRYSLWRQSLSHNFFSYQIPSVSSEELALPRLIRCELSRLRCHGHSLLFRASPACHLRPHFFHFWPLV